MIALRPLVPGGHEDQVLLVANIGYRFDGPTEPPTVGVGCAPAKDDRLTLAAGRIVPADHHSGEPLPRRLRSVERGFRGGLVVEDEVVAIGVHRRADPLGNIGCKSDGRVEAQWAGIVIVATTFDHGQVDIRKARRL